ncbi:AbrB/MazE/SpoVT family DNA-binding domain-containing protein [Thermoactinomyces mirandus]|uniref:AbrB/MazE/SpoVT family DNA-binding domain-containing protein n=1 Tax=Thermoactinomyces mirandus TaxID=2756294 RepID=A0A7W1XRP4_9BACL|nr:AbrB/MazE/SpoVT family DNA-binding domain-containing protein [Thermoactinomyces mirandus]MBA4602067.1 AbrB/MazE/SpoVT family DNA-binding domain-containing protein [Thermoactinomyces mirandus]
MTTGNVVQEVIPMSLEIKRIKVSDKRQITIPIKFFKQLNIQDEVDVFVKNGELVIRPAGRTDHGFATEILKDLVSQGYEGQRLIEEFANVQSRIRPAVEELISEADRAAKKALKKTDHQDKTAELFADLED